MSEFDALKNMVTALTVKIAELESQVSASRVLQGKTTITELDDGDTAWMLICCALVLMMTLPGLALFYGGKVFLPS